MTVDNTQAYVLEKQENIQNGRSSETQAQKDQVEDDDDKSLLCGYSRWTPRWLQIMHRPKMLVFFLCLCVMTQGMLSSGLIPVSITTLEKRFNLNSAQSGLFTVVSDVGVITALIPVCYWGNKGHKGRWIGYGMLSVAIGSFIIASPQFLAGLYDAGQNVADVCVRDGNPVSCATSGSNLNNYLFILILGQIFVGFGSAPLWTLAISYIDENVSQRSSPVYLGLYGAASTLGPAIGFVMGGMLLTVWGDIGKSNWQQLGISGTTDVRWYGAWWIGFLVAGVCAILCAIPVLGYAPKLPGAKKQRAMDIHQTHDALTKSAFGENLRDIPRAFWILTTNPTFLALTVMQIAEVFLVQGFVTFLPTLFQNLFSFSASNASLITGAIVVPIGIVGTIIGGVLMRVFRLHCGQAIRLSLIFEIICAILTMIFLTQQCPDIPFAGVTAPYINSSSIFGGTNLDSACNNNCQCVQSYEPVCNQQLGMTYYSPCYAGCTTQVNNGNGTEEVDIVVEIGCRYCAWTLVAIGIRIFKLNIVEIYDTVKNKQFQTWTNCLCTISLAQSLGINQGSFDQDVVDGLCDTSCGGLVFFMILFSLLVLALFCGAIPIQQAVLRVVPFEQRTMSLGYGWIFMKIFGAIPGGIIFGTVIDNTCILWKTDCGVDQTCLRYSSHQLTYAMFGLGMGLKIVVVCSLAIAYLSYKSPSLPEQEPGPSQETWLPEGKVVQETLDGKQNSQVSRLGLKGRAQVVPLDSLKL